MNKIVKSAIWIISAFIICLAAVISLNSNNQGIVLTSGDKVIESSTNNKKTAEKSKSQTIKIGSTGDILIHSPIFKASYNSNTDTYDFNNIFKFVKDVYSDYDYMVADLEQPLAGKDKEYSGFPLFNAPDEIANALKNNGVDLLLTANNHCYDRGSAGFYRTQQVLKSKSIDYIGTRQQNQKPYLVKDIKGIKVGMINYTYETEPQSNTKYINGIPMLSEDIPMLNSFNYNDLDSFYSYFQKNMNEMKSDGADVIIAYMHWGEEYSLSSNEYQRKIAQKLCDMGVDAIVGGHTHCIEPIDLISSDISGKKTPIIYSTGNQLSNQRKETLSKFTYDNPYFEDGVIFELSITKDTAGKAKISDVSYTATWCNLFNGKYYILPLDNERINNYSQLNRTSEMKNSLRRTKGLLDEGISKIKNNMK